MQKQLPNIKFCKPEIFDIEVFDFKQLYCNLSQANDHDPFSKHKIEFYLVLIVTKNQYTHYVDFKNFKLQEGSALFVSKNQVHHFNKTLKNAEGFAMVFSSSFLDSPLFLSGRNKINRLFNYHVESPVINKKEMGEDNLIDLSHNIYKEFNSTNNFAKKEMMATLMLTLFLKVERVKLIYSEKKVKLYWIETFDEFTLLVENQYNKTRSARDYCSQLSISYKLLNDIVKELAGKTVKSFIDDYVVVEIKRYLTSTSLTMKEIGFKTGFDDPSNMAKFFKKHTQFTLLQFRNQ